MSAEAMPAIGTLTARVQLMRRITTDEAEGGEVAVFAPLATVWGRVRQLTARNALMADGRGQDITHSVVIRYRTDLVAGDRIAHRGRTMSIEAMSDLNGRRVYLSCQCVERAVTG